MSKLTFHINFDHHESDEILLDSGRVFYESLDMEDTRRSTMLTESIRLVVAEKMGLKEEDIFNLKFHISASGQTEEKEE